MTEVVANIVTMAQNVEGEANMQPPDIYELIDSGEELLSVEELEKLLTEPSSSKQ